MSNGHKQIHLAAHFPGVPEVDEGIGALPACGAVAGAVGIARSWMAGIGGVADCPAFLSSCNCSTGIVSVSVATGRPVFGFPVPGPEAMAEAGRRPRFRFPQ